MQTILFHIIYGFFRLLAMLPLRVLYFFSGIAYLTLYYITGYRRAVVAENLRNAFPERDKEEIVIIEKQYYRHMCDLIAETVYQSGMTAREVSARVRYTNPEIAGKYFEQGKDVAGLLGHCNNWEWLFGYPLIAPFRCVVIYRPIKNRVFDRIMLKLRSRFNAHLVPMKVAPRTIYNYRQQGVQTITAFIADQSPPTGGTPQWHTFLNRDTAFFGGPEVIARKMKMAVIYLKMKKIKRGYYEFEFVPLADDASAVNEGEIIRSYVAELEKHIAEEPSHWLWSHRRWKHRREVQP
ncbi:MAG: lipid A biosynthesis acyltransferase [Marinilabiliales bacterium]|nr:MAG: lipid A biosynthesis acyltransferase [Marinilabiliales bacterium]